MVPSIIMNHYGPFLVPFCPVLGCNKATYGFVYSVLFDYAYNTCRYTLNFDVWCTLVIIPVIYAFFRPRRQYTRINDDVVSTYMYTCTLVHILSDASVQLLLMQEYDVVQAVHAATASAGVARASCF
jgi:hypothetical protein